MLRHEAVSAGGAGVECAQGSALARAVWYSLGSGNIDLDSLFHTLTSVSMDNTQETRDAPFIPLDTLPLFIIHPIIMPFNPQPHIRDLVCVGSID